MQATNALEDAAPTRNFSFWSVPHTHPGTVRVLNEDAYLVDNATPIWAVADGMGGHNAGDLASQQVIASLEMLRDFNAYSVSVDDIARALDECNHMLQQIAFSKGEGIIGSTVLVLTIYGRRFDCAWAGDSRLYQFQEGKLQQLTRDHSYVQELVDSGELDPAAAEKHPQANVITRAVGAAPKLYLDAISGDVRDGDIFLLCSDGLTKCLSDLEIGSVLGASDVEEAGQKLLDMALARGARDNVTLIVIRCVSVARNPGIEKFGRT